AGPISGAPSSAAPRCLRAPARDRTPASSASEIDSRPVTSENAWMTLHGGHMARDIVRAFGSLLLLGILVAPVAAQETTGTIQGVVTDQGGAVLPGVAILIRHVETGQTQELVSGAEGRYSVPYLRPGTYDVTFTLEGFQSVSVRAVRVSVNDRLDVNASLKVGGLTETIDVVGGTTLIQYTPQV